MFLIRHFQTLSYLGSTYGVDWPYHFRAFFQWWGWLNLDIWNYVSGFNVCTLVLPFSESTAVHLGTPLMFVVVLGVANVLAYLIRFFISMASMCMY